MSYFVRAYADFLNTKIRVHRALGFDICHVKAKDKMAFLKSETGPKVSEKWGKSEVEHAAYVFNSTSSLRRCSRSKS